MLISMLISIIILFFIVYYVYHKLSKNDIEKITAIILGIILILILVIYYLDEYNIPTALGLTNNINTEEWFNFIMSILVSMLGTFISAILVLATTMGQISRAEDNEQETHRINNMPFLKYEINIINNILNIKLKNIGNNTIKKYFIKVKNKNILSDYQNCLAVNDESKIEYKLSPKEKQIQIIVEYQDLLYNVYEQKIDISYIVDNNNKISIDKVIIEDEKLIKKEK